MVCFLEGVPSSEVYRDAIEHEVGCELTSAAREWSGQTSVQSALSCLVLSVPIAQLVKASQRFCFPKGLEFKSRPSLKSFKTIYLFGGIM